MAHHPHEPHGDQHASNQGQAPGPTHGHRHGHGHGNDTDIDWAEMAPHLEAQAELFTPCTSGPCPGSARR